MNGYRVFTFNEEHFPNVEEDLASLQSDGQKVIPIIDPDHWTHHNQFALQMAESTRDGFLKAKPDERPFILSRSGSTGMARAAAIWHGDSTSNYHLLQLTLPTALNLSLSGVPFNGADLGGFDGKCSPVLREFIANCLSDKIE